MADLSIQLSANTAELKKGVEEANKNLESIKENTDNVGVEAAGAFVLLETAVGAVSEVFAVLETTLRSNQVISDKLDETIGGLTNGISFLQIAVSSLDFDNLLEGFFRAKEAGEEYVRVMDDVADAKRGFSWRSSEEEIELERLRTIMFSENYSRAQRLQALEASRNITQRQHNTELKLAQDSYDAIYNKIKNTLGLTSVEMEALEQYIKFSGQLSETEQRNALRGIEEWKKLEEIRRTSTQVQAQGGGSAGMGWRSPSLTQEGVRRLQDQQRLVDQLYMSMSAPERALFDIATKFGNKVSDELRDALTNAAVARNEIILNFERDQTALARRENAIRRGRDIGEDGEDFSPAQTGARRRQAEQIIDPISERLQKATQEFHKARAEGDMVRAAFWRSEMNNIKKELDDIESRLNIMANPSLRMTSDLHKLIPLNRDTTINPIDINVPNPLNDSITGVNRFNEALEESMSNIWNLVDLSQILGNTIGEAFKGSQGVIEGLIGSLLQLGKSIIMAAIAYQIKAAAGSVKNFLTGGGWGLIAAAAGVTALTTLWRGVKLAEGGLAFGNTLAQVGEYSNVRSNPEVIAPLNKLKSLLGDDIGQKGEVRFVIEGNNLVGILERQSKKQIYF